MKREDDLLPQAATNDGELRDACSRAVMHALAQARGGVVSLQMRGTPRAHAEGRSIT